MGKLFSKNFQERRVFEKRGHPKTSVFHQDYFEQDLSFMGARKPYRPPCVCLIFPSSRTFSHESTDLAEKRQDHL
ncbi:hypothetical protein FMA36_02970 [Komagataeibacter xylinus]|uniref:Uncharacterized protein n=1 Tax=Komagataeibacter xylinus TaxID=28448 RepID=A0A857FK93_KOMXY|nr:hypothetical protein FMA36_02970 [Komagataeibacter xylinus]